MGEAVRRPQSPLRLTLWGRKLPTGIYLARVLVGSSLSVHLIEVL